MLSPCRILLWNVPTAIWAVSKKWILASQDKCTHCSRIVRYVVLAYRVQAKWSLDLDGLSLTMVHANVLKEDSFPCLFFGCVLKVGLLWLSGVTGLIFYVLTEDLVLTQDTMLECDLMVWSHAVKMHYKYPLILLLRSIWQKNSESNDSCVSWDDSSQLYSFVQSLCPATTSSCY